MKIRAFLLLAAISILTSAACAQDVKVEKYTLANGMTVILHEDHTLPVATVNLWYHVGSKDEPPHRSGFAHLFEHLMFMGTKRVPKGDFDNIMESGGGDNNASTTQDRTNFYDYGPSSLLPTLLWLEADRLEDLGKSMDQKKLNLQREVVKNERRQNVENAPYGYVSLETDAAMYPESHPYHIDTIGLPEDIDAATVKDVQEFFATYYVPNNATLVVAGDFDPAKIKPLIASLFGTLPRANDPIRKTAPDPALHGIKRLTMVDNVAQARTYMVWHSPAIYKPGDAEMDLIADLLTDGFASRLYQRLVVEEKLASDVTADQDAQMLGSLFTIAATAREGVSLDKLEAAIDDEIASFLKTGPTEDELKRIKAKYEFGALNSLQDLSDVADRLNQYDYYLGEPNSFKWDLDRHTQASATDIQSWGQKILDPNARLILRVVPTSDVPDTNPRNSKPRTGPDPAFTVPAESKFTLSNGIPVFYFSRSQLPLMSISTLFKEGAASDPAGKEGLASITAGMLDQGAGALDAEEFSKALEALGAYFGANSEDTSTVVSLSSTAENFEKALALYSEAIRHPQITAKDFERQKSLALDGLAEDADDPETASRYVALREFFGPTNPFGRNPSGTEVDLKAISADDVRQEHDALIRPDRAAIFVAGSLPLEQVQKDIEQQFGAWQASPAAKPIPTPLVKPPANKTLRVVIVDRPQAVQTVIRFIFPGVPYHDPNRIALDGLTTVLGGTFTSRLNADLREDKGYTYGAGSTYSFGPEVGFMTAESSVRADVTGPSLQEFLTQFGRLRTGDVARGEALKARESMRTNAILAVQSLGGLIGIAEELYENGRTLDGFGQDLKSISSLDAGQINAIAKSAVPLDDAVIVLIGDKDLILKQIAGLKLPKPEVVQGMQ